MKEMANFSAICSVVPTRMRDIPEAWILPMTIQVSLVYILYSPLLGF
jgi:hypothetical protein